MKLAEIHQVTQLTEGAMKDLHIDLLDAIANEFEGAEGYSDDMGQRIADWLIDNKDDDKVDSFLYDHFVGGGDMPYGTMKARDGDPSNWIADRMADMFKKEAGAIWRAEREAKK